jgi:ATP-dependent Lon protease
VTGSGAVGARGFYRRERTEGLLYGDSSVTTEHASPKEGAYEAPAILADDAILFPEMEASMTVQDSRSVAATVQAFREHNLLVLIPSTSLDGVVGTIGTLVLLRKADGGKGPGTRSLWKGLWRVRVDGIVERDPYVRVRFTKAGGRDDVPSGRSGMVKAVLEQIDEFARVMPGVPQEIISFLKGIDSPGKLADLCAYSPFFTREERLDLLRTLDPEERLAKVNGLFERQLSDIRRLAKATSILDCATCMDLADRAFDFGPDGGAEVAREFLDHVSRNHAEELLGVLAERYGPEFMRRRALK